MHACIMVRTNSINFQFPLIFICVHQISYKDYDCSKIYLQYSKKNKTMVFTYIATDFESENSPI